MRSRRCSGRTAEVMYFSRNAAPFIRDVVPESWLELHKFWLVVGTSSFQSRALMEYRDWPESTLEKLEKIEQFRFLEAGKRIASIETEPEFYRSGCARGLGASQANGCRACRVSKQYS